MDWPWGCRCDIGKYSAKYGQPSDSSPHRAQTGPPVHIMSQQHRSRVSWGPGGILFQLLCFSSLFFLLSPSLWLCCYFLVVVGDGDSRWLLGTLAHWCACQTARRRTTVSQPPPPLITISAYPQLQAVLGLVGGLVLWSWNEWWAWVSPHCFVLHFVSSRSRDRAESSCGQSIHQFALLSISHVMPTW